MTVRVQLPAGVRGNHLQLLVSKRPAKVAIKHGWAHFELPTILDHEVAVVG
jgi:hypothetical protein